MARRWCREAVTRRLVSQYGRVMPFKFNAARRHRIPRARYRVRNWSAYEAGLKRRGNLTLRIDEAALDGWRAPRRTTPGGQAIYSDLAIEMVLVLRIVFHLALRQAEAFAAVCFACWSLISAFPITPRSAGAAVVLLADGRARSRVEPDI
jgi:hypothetical protein